MYMSKMHVTYCSLPLCLCDPFSCTRAHTHTVSPHSIIEFVRLWLQQGGGNSHKFKKIVFSAATNPEFATTLVERYFPLAHYYFKAGTPGSVKRTRTTEAERKQMSQDQMGEEGEGEMKEEGKGEGEEGEEGMGENGEGKMGEEWEGEEGEGRMGEEGEGEEGEEEEELRKEGEEREDEEGEGGEEVGETVEKSENESRQEEEQKEVRIAAA